MKNYSVRQTINWLINEVLRLRGLIKKISSEVGVEVDPVFTSSPAHNLTSGDITFIQDKDYNSLKNLPDGLPQIEFVNTSSYTLTATKGVVMLTLEEANNTVNLDLISAKIGLIIFITNTGSTTSAITCNVADGNGIWEGGMLINSTKVASGTVMRIINDGVKYRVL